MKKNNLKQQAYQMIREKIINCEYMPGTLINESTLLEQVPGSRTPVRDAISRLEQEHLVTILPKRGILISDITSKDVQHFYEMRLLLEPYILLEYGNTLPEEFYLKYYLLFSSQTPAALLREPYAADDAMHFSMIKASRNNVFIHAYEKIHLQNHRVRILSGTVSTNRTQESSQEHVRILEACLKKDWKKAADEMTIHLTEAQKAVSNMLLQMQEDR